MHLVPSLVSIFHEVDQFVVGLMEFVEDEQRVFAAARDIIPGIIRVNDEQTVTLRVLAAGADEGGLQLLVLIKLRVICVHLPLGSLSYFSCPVPDFGS